MPVAGGPQRAVNTHGAIQPDIQELLEYEKILNIHDQIFSGNHPRLKVPQHVIRKVTPRSVHTPPLPVAPALSTEAVAGLKSKVHPHPPNTNHTQVKNTLLNGSATTVAVDTISSGAPTGRVSTTKTTSEIDPIFLTKSDDLIRAEIQLQRQRIERQLREHLDQKRIEAKQKISLQESQPDFDVSDVLVKALELVKPISTSDIEGANANPVTTDSFDENSFYSSKAPDSPRNGEEDEPLPVPEQTRPMDIDDLDADAHADRHIDTVQQFDPGDRNLVDLEMNAPFNVADKRAPSPRSPGNTSVADIGLNHRNIREQPDIYDEPEYSPPGPDIPSNGGRDTGDFNTEGDVSHRRRSNLRTSDRGQDPRRVSSPSNDVRVVRNHITSPAAPQPSRVSPLAVSKVPSLPQNRHVRHDNDGGRSSILQGSARTSPEAPIQPLAPRKRRRIQETRDKARVVEARRIEDSPEPYIKPEPISPPPFVDVPPTIVRRRHPQDASTFVDIVSPRYSPVAERQEIGARGPVYEDRYNKGYDVESPIDLSAARGSPRVGYRRPVRDDQNLRRVASLQHARQSDYAHEYPEPVANFQPRFIRSTSYTVSDRSFQSEKARYFDEPTQPYARRYISADVSPTSTRFRDSYAEAEPGPRHMAPPPRRVVVDAQGNRYYESLAAPKVQPLQGTSTRLSKAEAYNNAQAPNGSVRATSIIDDGYRDRRYIHDMPPPQVAYRRASEYPRSVVADGRLYAREIDDRAPVIRSGSVQVLDYPPRHATYVEEPPFPREEVVRMSSVRPVPTRYEEHRETLQRMPSVRPSGREISVYVDDEPREHRGYAPVERPDYSVVRPMREERYYEDEDASKLSLDGTREVIHRLPRRY